MNERITYLRYNKNIEREDTKKWELDKPKLP